jgi:hypothetical protein
MFGISRGLDALFIEARRSGGRFDIIYCDGIKPIHRSQVGHYNDRDPVLLHNPTTVKMAHTIKKYNRFIILISIVTCTNVKRQ